MKKIFYLLLLGLTVQNVQAQLDYTVKAGGNISYYPFNNEAAEKRANYDYGGGFQVGVMAIYNVFEKSDLKSELIYAKKGVDSENLNYINLPILMDYSFGNFDIEAGTEAGFLIFGKNDNGIIISKSTYQKRFDLSIVVGSSYNINDKIGLNLRYVRGIIPHYSVPSGDEEGNYYMLKVFNASLQLSLLYKLK